MYDNYVYSNVNLKLIIADDYKMNIVFDYDDSCLDHNIDR